jgi:hypothetical protein
MTEIERLAEIAKLEVLQDTLIKRVAEVTAQLGALRAGKEVPPAKAGWGVDPEWKAPAMDAVKREIDAHTMKWGEPQRPH